MSNLSRNKNQVKPMDAYHFLHVGYLDYIAARFLLNNDFIEQGITLSSTAVEKYIKAVLACKGVAKPVHLTDLGELEKLLNKENITLLDDLDRTYFKLLGDIYHFRYYDKLKSGTSYGFYKWQVLAELDATISYIESNITLKNQDGIKLPKPYVQDEESKNEHLWLNNYVLNGIDKKTFMEKAGPMFVMWLAPNRSVATITHPNLYSKYNEKICVVTSIETE